MASGSLVERVGEATRKHRLVQPGDRILAAVSGGADSMALLQTLADLRQTLDFSLAVAHLDHQLRGDESRADAVFVEAQAGRLDLPFHVEAIDVRGLARDLGISLEMAARRARYDFFRRLARAHGYHAVATGHTLDDQAETLLLRLARGAGGQGLSAMAWSVVLDGLRVIRPLREATRAELRAFLAERAVTWREDASNRDLSFLRNRVRHEVLPLLRERLNPRVDAALARAADLLEADQAWLEACAEAHAADLWPGGERGAVDVHRLAGLPLAARRRLIRGWLIARGADPEALDFHALERVLTLAESAEGSAEAPLPGGGTVRRTYARLAFAPGGAPGAISFDEILRIPGETLVPLARLRVVAREGAGRAAASSGPVGALPAAASFSMNRCGGEAVHIRGWREGDRIALAGSAGTKKIQDVFTDARVARDLRDRIPLVVCRGEVVWVPGYQVAGPWHLESEADPAVHVEIDRY